MTTGSVGPSAGTLLGPTFEGFEFSRTWNGQDGKWESYADGTRLKWNDYHLELVSRNRPTNEVTMHHPSGDYTEVLNISVNGFGDQLSLTARDDLRLQSKLLKKVKAHDFDLAVNLAQMGQITRMVDSTLGKLGRAILAVKRGDIATAARQLGAKPKLKYGKGAKALNPKDIGQFWLELQYGWRPLISDVYEASKAFEEISEGPRSALFRTSVWKAGAFEGSQSPSSYSSNYGEKLTRRLQYEMYEEMTANRQLGLMDPLSVGWEIIPYSFVVDWFIPIGTYLDNLNAIPKLKGRFLTTTTRRRAGMFNLDVKCNRFFGDRTGWSGNGYRDRLDHVVMDRTLSFQLDVPLPRFDLRGAVHGRRVFNAIALAQLRFGRTPRREPINYNRRYTRIDLFRGNSFASRS